jgi:hypothetical protein
MTKIVFTHHARIRLKERELSAQVIEQTVTDPDKVVAGRDVGTVEYQREFDGGKVTVVTGKTHTGRVIVLSCWRDPTACETRNSRRRKLFCTKKNVPFWKRIFMELKSIVGL